MVAKSGARKNCRARTGGPKYPSRPCARKPTWSHELTMLFVACVVSTIVCRLRSARRLSVSIIFLSRPGSRPEVGSSRKNKARAHQNFVPHVRGIGVEVLIQFVAVDEHLAPMSAPEAVQCIHQRGLACAAPADQRDK